MKVSHWLLPYDLFERHFVVGRWIADHSARKPNVRVLDVGGRMGLLSQFASCAVFSANVDGSGDVLYDGTRLPFADEAFDIVVAIDTLEHIPRERRLSFVQECLRVSNSAVILAAPFGSPGHAETEARLNALFTQSTGKLHPYLSEHVLYGLPDMEEIRQMVERSGACQSRLCFAGDYRREAQFFEAVACSRGGLRSRAVALVWHWRSRAVFNRVKLSDQPSDHTNRFFLELAKSSEGT